MRYAQDVIKITSRKLSSMRSVLTPEDALSMTAIVLATAQNCRRQDRDMAALGVSLRLSLCVQGFRRLALCVEPTGTFGC